MRWFRSNIRAGSYVALLALAVQLVLSFGHVHLNGFKSTAGLPLIGASQSVNQNQRLQTAHLNLIWSPVAFIDAGLEYMWGQRYTVAKLYGNEQVLISKFRVKF